MKQILAGLLLFLTVPSLAAQTGPPPTCTSSKTTRLVGKGSTWVNGVLKGWYTSADSVAYSCTKFPRDTVRITDTLIVRKTDTVFVARPDTTILAHVRGLELKPDSASVVAGGRSQFCAFIRFRDGKVASDPTAPAECLASYGAWFTMYEKALSTKQRARADSVYYDQTVFASGWRPWRRERALAFQRLASWL